MRVTARAAEPLHLAEATVHEGPGYPAGPEPRIIAYDAADSTLDDEVPSRQRSRSATAVPRGAGCSRSRLSRRCWWRLRRWRLGGLGRRRRLVGDDRISGCGAGDRAHLSARRAPRSGQRLEGDDGALTTPDGQAVLILYGLKQAPAGKEYQAWIVRGRRRPRRGSSRAAAPRSSSRSRSGSRRARSSRSRSRRRAASPLRQRHRSTRRSSPSSRSASGRGPYRPSWRGTGPRPLAGTAPSGRPRGRARRSPPRS